MLMHRGAVVSNIDRHASEELRVSLCKQADIIVTAVGRAGIVSKECVKEGAVVIDVGINFVKADNDDTIEYPPPHVPRRRWDVVDGVNVVDNPRAESSKASKKMKLVGDADFNSLVDHVGMVTPVPGGVGPVTVAMLLRNTVFACEYNNRHAFADVESPK
jgi:methylenetetrahydrofolate dehydrogenase (NADP+)/methenyltetrahydrofolate cyclohydrolase